MNVQSFLDQLEVNYRLVRHQPAFTAQDLAQVEHIPGRQVIKPVIVRADGEFVMCALPASYRIDMEELRRQIDAEELTLADEPSMRELFPECEVGAEPPIGRMFGLTTLMDESLTADDRVMFQAGTHMDAVAMSLAEYRRAAQPEMAHFARPIA